MPDDLEAANQAIRRKDYDAAAHHLAAAVAREPGRPDLHMLRGLALIEAGRAAEALASLEAALALTPGDSQIWGWRGDALAVLARLPEAIMSHDRAIALNRNDAELYYKRGMAQMTLRREDEAFESFDRAIALKPDYFEALVERGNAHLMRKRNEAAIEDYGRALAIQPESAGTLYNRGTAHKTLGHIPEALADYDRAMALEPRLPHLESARLLAKMQMCDWHGYARESASLLAHVAERAATPFPILSLPSTPAQQLVCARLYAQNKFPAAPQPLWRGERYAHPKIRIAYLCGGFAEHPVAVVLQDVLARHDRSRFEISGFSFLPDDGGPTRKRIAGSCDRFFDMSQQDDFHVAQALRAQETDIAVDLDGFTDMSRTGILAQRPAPVQVNWLGFPATMGADYIDYIIADRIVAPDESVFAEKPVRLPDTFFPAEAREALAAPPSRADCGLPEKGLVFCAFNNNYKITPDIFDIWMRLLAKIEGSVLWLRRLNDTVEGNLRREAAARGIDPARLVMAPAIAARAEHVARQQLGNIFLDTLYYNAHSTACDALWAGMPVVTWRGPAFAGRVAASLLHAVGMDDLVADSLEGYEAIALGLAQNPARLAQTRARLKTNLKTMPLFDASRFARNLESAYEMMLQRQQQGLAPKSFAIS